MQLLIWHKNVYFCLWENYRSLRCSLGPNHMSVLSTLDAIADLMAWNNEIDTALKYYKTILRKLRNNHMTSSTIRPTCLLLYKIKRIYFDQGDIDAAWKCLSQARVLLKQCSVLDAQSYALEKRIEGDMEKMEEQSNICISKEEENGFTLNGKEKFKFENNRNEGAIPDTRDGLTSHNRTRKLKNTKYSRLMLSKPQVPIIQSSKSSNKPIVIKNYTSQSPGSSSSFASESSSEEMTNPTYNKKSKFSLEERRREIKSKLRSVLNNCSSDKKSIAAGTDTVEINMKEYISKKEILQDSAEQYNYSNIPSDTSNICPIYMYDSMIRDDCPPESKDEPKDVDSPAPVQNWNKLNNLDSYSVSGIDVSTVVNAGGMHKTSTSSRCSYTVDNIDPVHVVNSCAKILVTPSDTDKISKATEFQSLEICNEFEKYGTSTNGAQSSKVTKTSDSSDVGQRTKFKRLGSMFQPRTSVAAVKHSNSDTSFECSDVKPRNKFNKPESLLTNCSSTSTTPTNLKSPDNEKPSNYHDNGTMIPIKKVPQVMESFPMEQPVSKFKKIESMFTARTITIDMETQSKAALPLKDDPKFTKYFKMLKVGMPKETVMHSMSRDAIDPTILNGNPNLSVKVKTETSELKSKEEIALKDNPSFTKYFKMLKVGMPRDSVKHAMKRDNIDPNILDGDPNLPVVSNNKISESAPKIALKDDPSFTKYFKMLKVGMPRDSVKHAMKRDNIDPNILDGDPNLPAVSNNKMSETAPKPQPKKNIRRTRVHWDNIRQEVKSGSVWALLQQDSDIDNLHIDEMEIKQLFEAEADIEPSAQYNKKNNNDANVKLNIDVQDQDRNQSSGKKIRSRLKKKSAAIRVIDPKRANNGGIILARVKISFDEIARVIDKMETSSLSQQQFQGILEYLPTSEEVKSLNRFLSGVTDEKRKELISTLCECEKFMVAMMNVNNAAKKITSLLFRLQFDTTFMELERDAALIDDACDELSNSLRLRKLLGIVLNVGNRVNMGAATAFSITSLLKLNLAKAMDKKTTILHYVVTVAQRNDVHILKFKEELPSLFKAEKVFWEHSLKGVQRLEDELENIKILVLMPSEKPNLSISSGSNELNDLSAHEMTTLSSTFVGQFVLDAELKIKDLRKQIDKANQSYTQLLQYFHEETLKSHEFFSIFVQFSKNVDAAKAEIEKKEKIKQRKRVSISRSISNSNQYNNTSSTEGIHIQEGGNLYKHVSIASLNYTETGINDDITDEMTEVNLQKFASHNYNSVLVELKTKVQRQINV